MNLITTTGSFGEFHTLLWDEHKKLIEATVSAVKKRVPFFIGCTNLNPREAIRQAKICAGGGRRRPAARRSLLLSGNRG